MRQYRKIYMWPVWVIALFTQAKSFRDNPVIGSTFLNRLGLHVIRLLLAQLSSHLRWFVLAPLMPRALRKRFHKDGFVLIEDFLPPEEVAGVVEEIASYGGTVRQMTQGDTATQRILLDRAALACMPRTAAAVKARTYADYLAYCGAKWSHSIQYIQRIHNGFKDAQADPQKNMHSDTFHPTIKAWLFLEDVNEDKGPFTYVPGSSRLTWKRLKWEYKRSVAAAQMNDKYSEKGSLRASATDLEEMGLPAPKGITAKAGTLVIANTNGFHGRGQAKAGASRLEIWAYSRHNPFSPWPGLPLDFVAHLKHRIMHTNWRRLDTRAKRNGNRPSWHLIDADQMVGSYAKLEKPLEKARKKRASA